MRSAGFVRTVFLVIGGDNIHSVVVAVLRIRNVTLVQQFALIKVPGTIHPLPRAMRPKVFNVSGDCLRYTGSIISGGGPNGGEKISQAAKVASEFTATASS